MLDCCDVRNTQLNINSFILINMFFSMKISLVYKMKYFFTHDIMMNFRQYG